jgi:nucleotide-binding universal stress UspA family protein
VGAPECTRSPIAWSRDTADDVVVIAARDTPRAAPTGRGGSNSGTAPSVVCVFDESASHSGTIALAADAARRLGRRLVLVPLSEETGQTDRLARIATAAEDERADLIVTPAPLSAGRTDADLYSLRLPRLVSCPVVAVPGPDAPPRRLDGPVVCGIDATDGSERALRAAAQLAVALGTRLALVHVAPVSESRGPSRLHAHAVFGNALWRVIRRLDAMPPVDLVLEAGEPARQLVTAAHQAGAALIVIRAPTSCPADDRKADGAPLPLASSVIARSDLPLMLVPSLPVTTDAAPIALSADAD